MGGKTVFYQPEPSHRTQCVKGFPFSLESRVGQKIALHFFTHCQQFSIHGSFSFIFPQNLFKHKVACVIAAYHTF